METKFGSTLPGIWFPRFLLPYGTPDLAPKMELSLQTEIWIPRNNFGSQDGSTLLGTKFGSPDGYNLLGNILGSQDGSTFLGTKFGSPDGYNLCGNRAGSRELIPNMTAPFWHKIWLPRLLLLLGTIFGSQDGSTYLSSGNHIWPPRWLYPSGYKIWLSKLL